MKNKTLVRFLTFGVLALAATTLQSCKDDEPDNTPTAKNYANGVFITNEGPFQSGSGSVAFWSRDNQTRETDIYNTVNGVQLGNIVQSISVSFGKAYVVVNNANKVAVVDAKTFENKGSIDGLALPRFFVGVTETKGYISEWVSFGGQGRVSVVDLTTNTVTGTITVGVLPEKMVYLGGKLFVANSNDSTISVINTQTDQLESTITVGDWPSGIEADQNGNLWVLCGGVPSWTGSAATSPELIKFNPASPTFQTTFDFGTPDNNPSRLTINGTRDKLYYLYSGGVFEFSINAGNLSASPVINRYFYGVGVDPVDGSIYGADAGNFTSVGKVVKYNSSFSAVDSFSTDIAPSDFWFVN